MTVTRVPASNPEPEVLLHWHIVAHAGRPSGLACGAPTEGSRYGYGSSGVTCPDCIAVVVRRTCLAPDPDDLLGFGIVCKRDLSADGTHEGPHDWEKPLTSALTNQERDLALAVDTPSGRLPVRTPGAALEEEREVMDDFQMEPSAENLAATREVIERWPA